MRKVRQQKFCSNVLQPFISSKFFYSGSGFLFIDLGQLYQSIPFKTLSTKIPLLAYEKSGSGRKPVLKVEGTFR
jgi:hypothetical protein